jgi:hypothetical protein
MSWTDKKAIETICYLRDKFKVKTFCETGTFKGINAELQSKNFEKVYTCEKVKEYFEISKQRLDKYNNIKIYNIPSKDFLLCCNIPPFPKEPIMFYLDAHFYHKGCKTNRERFVVLNELKSLEGRTNSIIIIHDVKNGLGGLQYDGIDLDIKLLRKPLLKVNPKFNFYTNAIDGCNPVTPIYSDIVDCGLNLDDETLDNIRYAWTCPRLTYRGILYAMPSKLSKEELNKLGLRKCN